MQKDMFDFSKSTTNKLFVGSRFIDNGKVCAVISCFPAHGVDVIDVDSNCTISHFSCIDDLDISSFVVCRVDNIKAINFDIVISALKAHGVPCAKVAPHSHNTFDRDVNGDDIFIRPSADMVGICHPLSGRQFHRILASLGLVRL